MYILKSATACIESIKVGIHMTKLINFLIFKQRAGELVIILFIFRIVRYKIIIIVRTGTVTIFVFFSTRLSCHGTVR